MVVDPVVLPPEAQTFNLNRCLGALASAYPDHYVGALTEWMDQVKEHVNGDAISFVTPQIQVSQKGLYQKV